MSLRFLIKQQRGNINPFKICNLCEINKQIWEIKSQLQCRSQRTSEWKVDNERSIDVDCHLHEMRPPKHLTWVCNYVCTSLYEVALQEKIWISCCEGNVIRHSFFKKLYYILYYRRYSLKFQINFLFNGNRRALIQ